MSVTVKAFLHRQSWREEPAEIRRFSIDQDVSSNYSYLVQKLAQVFPSVSAEEIVLSWEDSDGDYINVSTDDELLQALDQFDGSIFKIHLRRRQRPACCQPQPIFCPMPCRPCQPTTTTSDQKQGGEETMEDEEEQSATGTGASESQKPQPKDGPRHAGVICDGCNSGIYGVRYKCLVCTDYDLCSNCEKKGEHVDHNMVTIKDPHNYNPWGFPGGHHRGRGPWRGRRGGNHCRGRGGHGGHGGHGGPLIPPFFLQNLFGGGGGAGGWGGGGGGGGWGGGGWGAPGSFPCRPPQEKPAEAKSEEMETEQGTSAEPAQSSEEQAQIEREQRQSYLHDIGDAVSSFLRPFGVKVDVDVVDDEKKKESGEADKTTTSSDPPSTQENPSGTTLYPTLDSTTTTTTDVDPKTDSIETALAQLQGMGFDNEGGWLTELVRAKGGEVEKVLDALHPSQSD